MTKIYLAGHGDYAKGIVSALTMLIGEDHGVTPVCAYTDEISSIYQLEDYFLNIASSTAKEGRDLVLFTDIQGGSVNNVAIKIAASNQHIHLVCGMNLIMVMDFLLNEEKNIAMRIAHVCQSAQEAMCYMNQTAEFMALSQAINAQRKV